MAKAEGSVEGALEAEQSLKPTGVVKTAHYCFMTTPISDGIPGRVQTAGFSTKS